MAKQHKPRMTASGNFQVFIGRNFWLGKDPALAQRLVQSLDLAWDNETHRDENGKKIWSPDSIKRAYAFCGLTPPESPTPAPKPTPATQPADHSSPVPAFPPFQHKDLALHKALDLFLAEQKSRLEKGEIKQNTYRFNESDTKSLKRLLPDLPIHQIQAPELKQISGILIARPKCKNKDEAISVSTLRNWLMHLAMAFDWFSHPATKIGWTVPYFQWKENFTLDQDEAEKLANKPNAKDKHFGTILPTFNLNQIKTLYVAALPAQHLKA
jgi:hypothetical protein